MDIRHDSVSSRAMEIQTMKNNIRYTDRDSDTSKSLRLLIASLPADKQIIEVIIINNLGDK